MAQNLRRPAEVAKDVTILLSDENPRRRRALRGAVAGMAGWRVLVPSVGTPLPQIIAAAAPDLVLLGLRTDGAGMLRGLAMMPGGVPCAIVLFAKAAPELLADAARAGVIAWYPDMPPGFPAGLRMIHALATRQRQQAEALAQARDRMAIDLAKQLLMRERRMTEPEAYHWLRRQAMAGRRRIADLARSLVDLPPPEI